MAGSTGLEPAASGVTGRRSNQLNYDPDELSKQICNLRMTECTFRPANDETRIYQSSRFDSNLIPFTHTTAKSLTPVVWWAVQDSNL
jgi:hypothetical protein